MHKLNFSYISGLSYQISYCYLRHFVSEQIPVTIHIYLENLESLQNVLQLKTSLLWEKDVSKQIRTIIHQNRSLFTPLTSKMPLKEIWWLHHNLLTFWYKILTNKNGSIFFSKIWNNISLVMLVSLTFLLNIDKLTS